MGVHPDLFPRELQYPDRIEQEVARRSLGIAPQRKVTDLTEAEVDRLAAYAKGQTPIVVALDSLTSEQIRELPRLAFSTEEWDQLEDDDREYIEDNDEESQARVDALAEIFIDRWKWASDGSQQDTSSYSDYFHEWLSQETDLHRKMGRDSLRALHRFGHENGVDEDAVDTIVDEILQDAGNYTEHTEDNPRGAFWSEEITETAYVDEWQGPMGAMTEDEIERALDKINKETDWNLDRKDLNKKYEIESDRIETGTYVAFYVDWDRIVELAEEKIREEAENNAEAEGRALTRVVIPEIEAKNLPRPAQPVVYEWPDGYTVVDMVHDDTEIGAEEVVGILRIPVTSENKNKTTIRTRMKEGKLAPRRIDDEGNALFYRGEIAFQLESLELAHCVGWADMGYMDGIREHEIKIYSMRRPNNGKPVFTFEVPLLLHGSQLGTRVRTPTGIDQIKSYSNGVPGFPSGQTRTPDLGDPATYAEVVKKLNKGDVEKVIDFVIFLKVDPDTIADLGPVIRLIHWMANAADQRSGSEGGVLAGVVPDEWAVRMVAKLNAARGISKPLPPLPAENPGATCEKHGACDGFCRPYRSRARANPARTKDEAEALVLQMALQGDEAELAVARDLAIEADLEDPIMILIKSELLASPAAFGVQVHPGMGYWLPGGQQAHVRWDVASNFRDRHRVQVSFFGTNENLRNLKKTHHYRNLLDALDPFGTVGESRADQSIFVDVGLKQRLKPPRYIDPAFAADFAKENPSLDRKAATEAFFELLQDPDPNAMEIAQDLAMENGLSLADLGEEGERRRMLAYAARAPGNSGGWRDLSGSTTVGWFRLAPAFSTQPMPAATGVGWRVASAWTPAPRYRTGTVGREMFTGIELRYVWNSELRSFTQPVAFRTLSEVRRAAAAYAWRIARKIKSLPSTADIADEVYDALNEPDPAPPALHEHARKKKPTFIEAQDAAMSALQRAGWAISGPLKIRWAQSPSTRLRLWFKPQSVLASRLPEGVLDNTHRVGDARTLGIDARDFTGSEFVEEIRRRFPRDMTFFAP